MPIHNSFSLFSIGMGNFRMPELKGLSSWSKRKIGPHTFKEIVDIAQQDSLDENIIRRICKHWSIDRETESTLSKDLLAKRIKYSPDLTEAEILEEIGEDELSWNAFASFAIRLQCLIFFQKQNMVEGKEVEALARYYRMGAHLNSKLYLLRDSSELSETPRWKAQLDLFVRDTMALFHDLCCPSPEHAFEMINGSHAIYIPSGWEGHAISLFIIKEQDVFHFMIYNQGEQPDTNPFISEGASSLSLNAETLSRGIFYIKNIDSKIFLDPNFYRDIYNSDATNSNRNILYPKLYEYLVTQGKGTIETPEIALTLPQACEKYQQALRNLPLKKSSKKFFSFKKHLEVCKQEVDALSESLSSCLSFKPPIYLGVCATEGIRNPESMLCLPKVNHRLRTLRLQLARKTIITSSAFSKSDAITLAIVDRKLQELQTLQSHDRIRRASLAFVKAFPPEKIWSFPPGLSITFAQIAKRAEAIDKQKTLRGALTRTSA